MKRYVKPSVLVENVKVTCGICAGSPAIKLGPDGVPVADTNSEIGTGNAQDAMAKGYITHYDAWTTWNDID